MDKTFRYSRGTVTVHGIERWPSERFVSILTSYLIDVNRGKEEEDAA